MKKDAGKIIKDPEERFLAFVELPKNLNDCWEWRGRTNYKGYGVMKINNRSVQAHRFSYGIYVEEIPRGLLVCHHCDNPACVNPNHLFIGTIQDNNLDRDKKGRKALGEQNGKSKLTEKEVKDIIELFKQGYSSAEIARRFNHPHSTIHAIRIGRSWSWLDWTS